MRIARLLWLVARKEGAEALQRDLEAARSEVMGPFSGVCVCVVSRRMAWVGRG